MLFMELKGCSQCITHWR